MPNFDNSLDDKRNGKKKRIGKYEKYKKKN